MRNITVSPICTPQEAQGQFEGTRFTYAMARDLGYSFITNDTIVRDPEGNLVGALVREYWSEEAQARHLLHYAKVKGDPSSRPEIFGKGEDVRLPRLRKDGTLGPRIQAPAELARFLKGEAAIVGPYRSRGERAGEILCRPTPFTLKHPEVYEEVMLQAREICRLYEQLLPVEFARQKEYIDTLAELMKIPGSLFTAAYLLKNVPTAIHVDEFDFRGATGVVTTCGDFEGNEFILPEYKLAFDVQPDAVLFADVHRWHGNLPKRGGTRISQVWFVRSKMHLCGEMYGAVALHH